MKGTKIDAIEETETRRLKLIKMSSKTGGATLSVELPDVLCATLSEGQSVNLVIDSKPVSKGSSAKLYVEGSVFKKVENDGLQIIGSIGGLRLVLNLNKATSAKSKTFDSDKFYMVVS
ncbi:hypothetical protein EU519_00580 [Candidatus Thorarchaeota archaeon]|nr:MAG: hypothetical protein EU519_00580 [Candidatus Thorarchaeota archaeon]